MNENSMYIWGEIHSSMVKGIIYEKHTSRLYVNFVKGSVYSYVNVSSDFVRKIFNVPSVGKFLNANLFGKYKSSSSELDCHTFSKLAIQLNLYKTTHSTNSINPYSPSVSNGYLKQNDNQSNSSRSVILPKIMSIYNSSIAYVNLDATKSHVIHSNSKVPFFFGNLVDYSSLESSLVKQHKDICVFFIKNYEPKLKLPSVSILENQNQILKFVPDKSRPYLKSVLSCFNIEFEISTHRKTIAGSCCSNKKLGYAKISIIGYLNKYKCLTIILHELAHAINSFSETAHDNSWKLVYSFLLMNFYRFYPEKYKRELLWGILYTPATLKLSNFYSKGVLFGSFADDPKKIIERQIIDLTSKKYSSFKDMICDYAIAIKFEFEIKENLLEVLEREEVSNFLFSCVKEMSLRAILASIEDTRINVQDIEQLIEKSFSEFPNKNNISLKLKMISDVVVFCWSKYCSLDRDQVNCILENVQSPNFFYKAIAQLALLK